MEDIVNIAVHGIAIGGNAVGKVTGPEGSASVGMTGFVPFAAPGETVTAQVTKRQKRYLEAELVSVDTPAPERVEPPCPYFGTCGGCELQHMAYDAQLAAKTAMVRSAFRAARLPDALQERIAPVVPGPPYEYRRRVTFHIGRDGSLGYLRRRSHTLLPVADCPISEPPIRALLASGFTVHDVVPDGFAAVLVVSAEGETLHGTLVLSAPDNAPVPPVAVTRAIARLRPAFASGTVRGPGDKVLNSFGNAGVASGYFLQGNVTINGRIREQVKSIAAATKARTAFDLYAGAGNFALALAAQGVTVTAVEGISALVEAGITAASNEGVAERVRYYCDEVGAFLELQTKSADLIVADPPRAGMERLVPQLPAAREMILISCHLPSAIRDIRGLTDAGWSVQSITPYDMFAQTTHVELVTHLSRA